MRKAEFFKIATESRSSHDEWARSLVEATSDVPDDELISLFDEAFLLGKLRPPRRKELIAALKQLGTGTSLEEMAEIEPAAKHGRRPALEEMLSESPQVNSLRAKNKQLQSQLEELTITNETLKRMIHGVKKLISKLESFN